MPEVRWLTAIVTALVLVLSSGGARAAPVKDVPEYTEPTPPYLEGVGIDEHLSTTPPLGLQFRDETGKTVSLRDYFDGRHPVILTLNYSNCPMLCSLELNGLVHGLQALAWKIGDEFRIVTVSIDPKETPEIARGAQARYVRDYGKPEAAAGWHFLSGSEENIHALADAVGFRYRYDEKAKQYYHAAALMLLTPKGVLARYLYGVSFTPETLRLGLVEASEGKIGTTVDQLILFCCAYDPKQGSYSAVANRVMTVAALGILLALVVTLGLLWAAELRKKRRNETPAP